MNRVFLSLLFAVVASYCFAAEPSVVKGREKSTGGLRFSLLPRSLQNNPEIECNVVTELMPDGQKFTPPSPERPVYYVLQPGYYQSLGEAAPANAKPPAIPELRSAMIKALAASGYLEAQLPEHPPTLVVVFNYGDHSGSHAEAEAAEAEAASEAQSDSAARDRFTLEASVNPGTAGDSEGPAPTSRQGPADVGGASAEQLLPYVLADPRKHRQVLERASLLDPGFVKELAAVLKDEVQVRRSASAGKRASSHLRAETERQQIVDGARGSFDATSVGMGSEISSAMDLAIASPFYRFYHRDAKTAQLVDMVFGSCYFVVASALDGSALAKGDRRVLWRTKMTTSAAGIAMADTLPTLISVASPHFGRPTKGTETHSARVSRRPTVEVGPVSPVPTADGTSKP